MRPFNRLLLLTVFISQPTSAFAIWSQAIETNNEGIELLQEESYYLAYKKFVDALAIEPFDPSIRMNLALALMANEEVEKAIQEFDQVVRLSQENPNLRFQALFNLAIAHSKNSDVDSALEAYQRALELNPDSIEVKTNIELLWQQMQGQGQGEGEQENQDPQQNQDEQGEGESPQDQENKENDGQEGQQPQNKPEKKEKKPFNSKELSSDDVRKILEEIKNQEQSIRAKEYDKTRKESPNEKDW